MKIGVLALQGAFIEHINMLNKLNAETVEIRQKSDFTKDLDGIVLPGGESTAMKKLLLDLDLYEPIKQALEAGMPAFGTCAGLILMAKEFEDSTWKHFELLDIKIKRHGFGRQVGSFRVEEDFADIGKIPMVFIRGPYITEVRQGVDVLAKIGDKIVAVRQNNLLGVAFHPELTDNTGVHSYFLNMVKNCCEN
ncbi:MAG: pyridoxal 5'-phosphate synthase glutaminase subunit PdxT [Defluviitaleaceae bacterium]|nr:pyridoxal 5'-phosphate synthase glutaminase subunit PdxT [Defluviitaleaceae bacterium]